MIIKIIIIINVNRKVLKMIKYAIFTYLKGQFTYFSKFLHKFLSIEWLSRYFWTHFTE